MMFFKKFASSGDDTSTRGCSMHTHIYTVEYIEEKKRAQH